MLPDYIGRNLRKLRREREVTQVRLAQSCGLSQAYVSSIERGLRPSKIQHVEGFARALHVPVELLFLPPQPVQSYHHTNVEQEETRVSA